MPNESLARGRKRLARRPTSHEGHAALFNDVGDLVDHSRVREIPCCGEARKKCGVSLNGLAVVIYPQYDVEAGILKPEAETAGTTE